MRVAERMLSSRGKQFFEYQQDALKQFQSTLNVFLNLYHPETNPDGVISMHYAHSELMYDLIVEKLTAPVFLRKEDLEYSPFRGTRTFLALLADFMAATLDVPVTPNDLIVLPGATACLSRLATVLCDPGDAILVPAPLYYSFIGDFKLEANATAWPVNVLSSTFEVTREDLEVALADAKTQGVRVRAVALASPDNPTGRVRTEAEIAGVLEFCLAHDLHLIADEVYANTVFDGTFVSMAKVAQESFPDSMLDRVHTIWSFSKDFGLAGLRVGAIFSCNSAVISSILPVCRYASVPTQTQLTLSALLSDQPFLSRTLSAHTSLLNSSYRALSTLLDKHSIEYVPAQAGFFVWARLMPPHSSSVPAERSPETSGSGERSPDSSGSGERSREEEEAAYLERITASGVRPIPGHLFLANERGWFRLIHAMHPDKLNAAIRRLDEFFTSQGSL